MSHYHILGASCLGADDDKVFHDADTVGKVQRKLLADGVSLPRFGADGSYGNETRDGILFWRRAHGPGFEGDGEVRASLLRLMGIPVPGEKGLLTRAVDWVYEKAVGPSAPAPTPSSSPTVPSTAPSARASAPTGTTLTTPGPAPGTQHIRPPLTREQKIKIGVGAAGAAALLVGIAALARRS